MGIHWLWAPVSQSREGLEFRDSSLVTGKVIWSYYFQQVLCGLRTNISLGAGCPLPIILTLTVHWVVYSGSLTCVEVGGPSDIRMHFSWTLLLLKWPEILVPTAENKRMKEDSWMSGILGDEKELKASGASGPFLEWNMQQSHLLLFSWDINIPKKWQLLGFPRSWNRSGKHVPWLFHRTVS